MQNNFFTIIYYYGAKRLLCLQYEGLNAQFYNIKTAIDDGTSNQQFAEANCGISWVEIIFDICRVFKFTF